MEPLHFQCIFYLFYSANSRSPYIVKLKGYRDIQNTQQIPLKQHKAADSEKGKQNVMGPVKPVITSIIKAWLQL